LQLRKQIADITDVVIAAERRNDQDNWRSGKSTMTQSPQPLRQAA
jgi:hypothetical protein